MGLDLSHFTGRGSNRGEQHRGGPAKKSAKEVLVLRTEGQRQKAFQLRRALIEIGKLYQCAHCGLNGIWLGQPLMLEVEHINGNFLDDRASNLKFLCPNCHAQTPGYCSSKGNVEIASVAKYCRELRRRKRGSGGMADALRLERSGENHGGSTPSCPTKKV